MLRRILVVLASSLLVTLSAAAPAPAGETWRTTGTSWENPEAKHPLVVGLRYAQHENFDRVVIDIDNRLPGYKTRYHRDHTYDGSGADVPIRGGLAIRLFPAYAHGAGGKVVYDGPKLTRPGFETLKGIAFTGDYEGYVSFAFGLEGYRAPYRIMRLHYPQRIVIDFKHAS
jgi:hypothetical protein